MIFLFNVLSAFVAGSFMFYTFSLWVLMFFKKRKLVMKLVGDGESLCIYGMFSLFSLFFTVADIMSARNYNTDMTVLSSAFLLVIVIIMLSMVLTGTYYLLSKARSKFIED